MSLDTNYPAPEPADLDQVDLSPVRLLQEGYDLARERWWEVMGVIAATMVISAIFSRVPFGGLIASVVDATAVSGLTYFMVKQYRGDNPPLQAIFEPMRRHPLPVLLVVLAQMILTGVGFALLVLPGLFMAIAVAFALPLVLLSNLGPFDAILRSIRIVSRRWQSWMLVMAAIAVINVIAMAAFGVGLLVSLPATLGGYTLLVAQAFRVRRATTVQSGATSNS